MSSKVIAHNENPYLVASNKIERSTVLLASTILIGSAIFCVSSIYFIFASFHIPSPPKNATSNPIVASVLVVVGLLSYLAGLLFFRQKAGRNEEVQDQTVPIKAVQPSPETRSVQAIPTNRKPRGLSLRGGWLLRGVLPSYVRYGIPITLSLIFVYIAGCFFFWARANSNGTPIPHGFLVNALSVLGVTATLTGLALFETIIAETKSVSRRAVSGRVVLFQILALLASFSALCLVILSRFDPSAFICRIFIR